jgi:hypothetical protein
VLGAAALALGMLSASARIDPSRGNERITVIYVGADDCAPCRTWRRDQWPKFQVSREFARITYREVTSPRLFDLMNDEYWPDDLRDRRTGLGRAAGVPLWLVLANDRVMLNARGLRQWDEVALPAIRSLVR